MATLGTILPEPFPQSSTLNPQPSTPNPQPSTLNLQPPTHKPQPSTLNPQPSTLNPSLSTPNPKPHTPSTLTTKLSPRGAGGGRGGVALGVGGGLSVGVQTEGFLILPREGWRDGKGGEIWAGAPPGGGAGAGGGPMGAGAAAVEPCTLNSYP